MIVAGAALLGCAVAALGAALLPESAVEARLGRIVRRPGRGGRRSAGRYGASRTLAAVITFVAAIALGAPLLAPALAYGVFIAPSLIAERRAAAALEASRHSVGVVVEWLDALVVAGRPAEAALLAVARHETGAALLDSVLRDTATARSLGGAAFRVLAAGSAAAGLTTLAGLAAELERSRDLGQGSRAAVRDARDSLRRDRRARAIAAASAVEGRLMLVLVCCYLPALMLAVVVPLFVGLMGGLLE